MPYGPRFEEALVYAAGLHRDQVRKASGAPYVTHLLGVAALVGDAGGTEDEVIAALLHDAVEDQGGLPTLEEIRRRFGGAVADIVMGCTDATTSPKPPWRARKEAYLAHLDGASPAVLRVSCADKLYNVRTIVADLESLGDDVWTRFAGGRDGTLWYYATIAAAFRRLGAPERLVGPLEREVEHLNRIAGAKQNNGRRD